MSKKTYLELHEEIAKLQAQADKQKASERNNVLVQIKKAIAVYDITAADLGLTGRGKANKAGKVKAGGRVKAAKKAGTKMASAMKYRDTAGNAWSGRGPRPGWLKSALDAGATLESFAV